MSDLHNLTDAFTELERRADAFGARTDDMLATTPTAHRSRLTLVAASAAAVVVVAGGSAWLAHSGGNGNHHGIQAAASQPAAPATPGGQSTSTDPATPTAAQLPETPAQLADRFRAVLAGTATFTVTDTGAAVGIPIHLPALTGTAGNEPSRPAAPVASGGASINFTAGAAIVGTLTASGATGGFDLQWLPTSPGARAQCDDPDRSNCKVQQLADGSSLATGTEALWGSANGVTYQADLIRPDGTEFLMHVSNERDPKGESSVLADQPPLSVNQMVAVVTSPLWGSSGN